MELFKTFDTPMEKGSSEWKTFNIATHDRVSLLNANSIARRETRAPSAIRFGASRLFILKRA